MELHHIDKIYTSSFVHDKATGLPIAKKPEVFTSEKEKLEVIQMRKDLGLDTMLDTIKKDNPHLTDKEAESKLKELLEQRIDESRSKMKEAMGAFNNGQESKLQSEDTDESDRDGSEE